MSWHSIRELSLSASNEISASVETGLDSPWFSGHFPGDPILPGIAQLAMVFEAIEQGCDRKFTVSGVRRVKFRQIVRPDVHMRVVVAPLGNYSYSFRLMAAGEPACKGIIEVSPANS